MSTPRPLVHAQLVCADIYGVPHAAILARCRTKKLAEARAVAMWIGHHRGYSYSEIGRAFGRYNTTVMSAVARIAAMIETNPELARSCADCLRAWAIFEAEYAARIFAIERAA